MNIKDEQYILDWYEKNIPYSCLKTSIMFYKQGDENGASKLLWSEQDKLRSHPELIEVLCRVFPTYKKKIEDSI